MKLKKHMHLCGAAAFLVLSMLVWRHHQRLHYRSFFAISNNISFTTASVDTIGLSTIIQNLNGRLTPTITNSQAFGTLGREIQSPAGLVEVYEYENIRVAKETHQFLAENGSAFALDSTKIYQEENFLLHFRGKME